MKAPDLLKCVEKIAVGANGSELKKEFLNKYRAEIKALSGFLEITETQVVFFCIMINLNFGNTSVNLNEIAVYLGSNTISILKFLPDLEMMAGKGIITRYENQNRRRKKGNNVNHLEFIVERDMLESLRKGEKCISKVVDIPDVYALLEHISKHYNDFREGEMTLYELYETIRRTLAEQKNLPFVKGLEKYAMISEDLTIYLLLCTVFLEENEAADLMYLLKFLFSDLGDRMRVRREFLRGTHTLIQKGLVKLEESNFRSDKELYLTDDSLDLLLQDDRELFLEKKKKKTKDSCILTSEIPEKELYFSGTEEKSLGFLTDILKPGNYNGLVGRMKDAGMRTGVAVLLYGPPGTGKTESVYQLARMTGRDIQMVSISETKSMWFGESEKMIKKIFDDYRLRVSKSKVAPILLFNEADGILGSRKKIGTSAVDQTENAIQNIILQELEDLQGILIATTNLTQNLDQAFERRFLYKICFEKPDIEARTRIWQDKIKDLPAEDARQLSQRFELSGGQIENIARKCLLQQMLYGTFPALNEIEAFCREEQISRAGGPKMGFIREPRMEPHEMKIGGNA